MTGEAPIQEAFALQAVACDELGSPFMGRLCRLIGARLASGQGAVAERLLSWPSDPTYRADSVPLRLAGGLHALVLSGASPALVAVFPPRHDAIDDDALWSAVSSAMVEHEALLQRWLDSPPQTNEVRRSAALYLGLTVLAQALGLPVVLTEIGASAGLNLNLDRYAYRFSATAAGEAGSSLTLAPDWRGPSPPAAEVVVAERRGCDISPLDIDSEEGRLRLLSYLWADQAERLVLTRAALEIAAAHPVTVERRDAAAFVAARLAEPSGGRLHVVAHSIMWQYMPEATQAAIRESLDEAGCRATAARPLAWLRLEPDGRKPGAGLALTLWPGGETRQIARCDFHGRWIEIAET